MATDTKQSKPFARNALIPDAVQMEAEFGAEFIGDAKRVAHKVETRVKTNAQRYGYFKDED